MSLAGLSAEQAAGVPCVYLTAYFALFFLAHPRAGDTLLIHSASGGVGSALVQLARVAGCRTVGVVGASPFASAIRCAASRSPRELTIDASQRYLRGAHAHTHPPEPHEGTPSIYL